MKYYAALKKHELLIKAAVCVNLKIIMPRRRSQTKKVYILCNSIYINSRKRRIIFGVRKWIRHCLGGDEARRGNDKGVQGHLECVR